MTEPTEEIPLWKQAGLTEDDQELVERYVAIKQSNADAIQYLAQHRTGLDPLQSLEARLDMVIHEIFESNPSGRFHFEMEFETRMHHALEQGKSEVTRRTLLEGVSGVGR